MEDGAGPAQDVAAFTPDHVVELGRLIRRSREGRFTVQQLGQRADVSPGLISQIERGQGNPSFQTLYKLSVALGLRIGDMLDNAVAPFEDQLVVRKPERKRLQLGEHGLVWELLTPNLQGELEMLRTSVPPGFTNEENPFRHRGEECVLLLHGTLEVSVAGRHFVLEEGDSITYDSGLPHWWRNSSGEEAVIVGAVTPPSF
ncbi:MAG: cupin domain-containing protein [Acidimicrobiia bacterium]|nr:cupin domain-containing protein [Acidimicrobiia bacterium]